MFNSVFESDVIRTLDHFRQTMNQLVDRYHSPQRESKALPAGSEDESYAFTPALESGWSDSAWHLRAILPGVSEKDVTINVQSNQLTLEGERKAPEYWSINAYSRLVYGKFYSSIALPEGLNLDNVKCRMRDGVLDIEVPMSEQMKPRQIKIESGELANAIAA